MKRGAFIPFTLLLLSISGFAVASTSLFEQGNAKYKEGDFKGAMQAYQKYLEAGHPSAAVYFNLGNAALRAGEKGQALVYYERARKAAPRDADLLWNIKVLKGVLPDKIEPRTYFVLAWAGDLLERLTADEPALAFMVFLALFALVSTTGFFAPALRGRLAPLFTLVWVGLFASGVLFAGKIWQSRDPLVVVLDKQTYAHYGPSESETKAFLLHEGAEGRKQDESGDWIFLWLANGNSGWIRKDASETV